MLFPAARLLPCILLALTLPLAVVTGAATLGLGTKARAQASESLKCEDWRLFQDADFHRHAATLESLEPCISYEPFTAGGLEWRLVRLQQGPTVPERAPLVVVLHDDEDAALAGALGLLAVRNVQVVTLDADEGRFWGGVDPNRMFIDVGAPVGGCPHVQNLDDRFAAAVLRDWDAVSPVLSLHSNAPGYLGDGGNGLGSISMHRIEPHQHPYPATIDSTPETPTLSNPDNLIYITGPWPRPGPWQSALLPVLNDAGLNVLYSQIDPLSQDCSLSDFLTLRGHSELYFNVEVKEGDTAAALTMTRKLMRAIDLLNPLKDDRP